MKASYLASGLTTRVHKRTNTLPHNVLSFDEEKNVLNHYSEAHAILLPGRIPGYKHDDIQLLPTKKGLSQAATQ